MNTRAQAQVQELRLSRGQSLVLMGLSMLLMTLLVCMTLSFGQKAKEKMELQMIADQAAYSTSVATARAFNQLAVMNRTIVAHNVVMIGVNASITFTSLWYGIIFWLMLDYAIEIAHQLANCRLPFGPFCGCWGWLFVLFTRFIPTLIRGFSLLGSYPGLEMQAISQANAASLNAMFMYFFQVGLHLQFYYTHLGNQTIARNVKNVTSTSEIIVPGGGDAVAKKEIGTPYIPFTGAVNLTNLILSDRHAVAAAMGSRTSPWTSGHLGTNSFPYFSDAGPVIGQWLRQWTGRDVNFFLEGNAYFSDAIHGNYLWQVNSTFAVSDDHLYGIEQYTGPGCSGVPLPVISLSLLVANSSSSKHLSSGAGFAVSFPSSMIIVVPTPPFFRFDYQHQTTNLCLLDCPSAWSNFVDYDQRLLLGWFFGGGDNDNWGQPKAPVTVQRDYQMRAGAADPWDLAFNLRWGANSTNFSMKMNNGYNGNNGIMLDPRTSGCGGNCNISKQTALSTGITYYHRGGQHFKEPPNLFNPWWKAGLIHSDADSAAATGSDIPDTLNNSGAGWATDSYYQLRSAGFKGWQ